MKKMLLIAMMAAGLVACTTSPAPKEDTKLKDAYSACIKGIRTRLKPARAY